VIGQEYIITIAMSGKLTVTTNVTLTEQNPELFFTVAIPNASGTYNFYMPSVVALNSSLFGRTMHLTWGANAPATADTKGFVFERFLLYRSDYTGVDMSDELLLDTPDEMVNSYRDMLPQIGHFYYYRLYKKFGDSQYGVKLYMGTNEVSGAALTSYAYSSQFGQYGSGDGEFDQPQDIAVYDTAKAPTVIYVTDYYNGRVQKLDPTGAYISQIDICCPGAITIDAAGNIYVSDWDYIYKYSPDGTLLDTFGDDEDYDFYDIEGVAVGKDSTGTEYLFVADYGNYEVYKLTTSGVLVNTFAGTESADGYGFDDWYPTSIAVGKDGLIYVGTHYHDMGEGDCAEAIFVFDQDGNQLAVYLFGDEYNYMCLAVNDQFMFYADQDFDILRIFDIYGNPYQTVGSYGSGDGQFDEPKGVDFDSAGNVYVVDVYNNRVQIFSPLLLTP
jgi:DNA-binding beta-propeller fold protein YncE